MGVIRPIYKYTAGILNGLTLIAPNNNLVSDTNWKHVIKTLLKHVSQKLIESPEELI